jgi:thioredoxin 1
MRPIRMIAAAGAMLGAVSLAATGVAAMERVPYDMDAVGADQFAGKRIILGIWTTWCATCQAQLAVLDTLADDPRFAEITIYRIDYDFQKNVMRLVGAPTKSMMIALHGYDEVGRLINVTRPEEIEAFLLDLAED